MSCSSINVDGDSTSVQFAFVIVGGLADVAGVQFGIEYDSTVDVLAWQSCTGGSEISSPAWPDSGTGNAVVWGEPQTPSGSDSLIVVGYFTLAQGSHGQLSLAADPRIGIAQHVNSDGEEFRIDEGGLGILDVAGDGGGDQGCGRKSSLFVIRSESSLVGFPFPTPSQGYVYPPTTSILSSGFYPAAHWVDAPYGNDFTSRLLVLYPPEDGANWAYEHLTYHYDPSVAWGGNAFLDPPANVGRLGNSALPGPAALRHRLRMDVTPAALTMLGATLQPLSGHANTRTAVALFDQVGRLRGSQEIGIGGTSQDSVVVTRAFGGTPEGAYILSTGGPEAGTYPVVQRILSNGSTIAQGWTTPITGFAANYVVIDMDLDGLNPIVLAGELSPSARPSGELFALSAADGSIADHHKWLQIDADVCPSPDASNKVVPIDVCVRQSTDRTYVVSLYECPSLSWWIEVRQYVTSTLTVLDSIAHSPPGEFTRIQDVEVRESATGAPRVWLVGSTENWPSRNLYVATFEGDPLSLNWEWVGSNPNSPATDAFYDCDVSPDGQTMFAAGASTHDATSQEHDNFLAAFDWDRTTGPFGDQTIDVLNPFSSDDFPRSVDLTGDRLYVAGEASRSFGDGRAYMINYLVNPNASVAVEEDPSQIADDGRFAMRPMSGGLVVASNAGGVSNARARVFDVLGRVKVQIPFESESILLELDPGVYFVQIVSGDRLLWTGKGIVTN